MGVKARHTTIPQGLGLRGSQWESSEAEAFL